MCYLAKLLPSPSLPPPALSLSLSLSPQDSEFSEKLKQQVLLGRRKHKHSLFLYLKGPLFFNVLQSFLLVHGKWPVSFPGLPVHYRALSPGHWAGTEAPEVKASVRSHVGLNQVSRPSHWTSRLRHFRFLVRRKLEPALCFHETE